METFGKFREAHPSPKQGERVGQPSVLRSLSLIIGIVAIVVLTIGGYGLYVRRVASNIVKDVGGLVLGQSRYEDVLALQTRYRNRVSTEWTFGAAPRDGSGRPLGTCTRQSCMFNFRVNNSKLAWLHIVKPADLTASVIVEDSRVVFAGIDLFGDTDGNPGGVVSFAADARWAPPNPHNLSYRLWQPRSSVLIVLLNETATPKQRQRALNLNLSCLTTRTGCNEPQDFMPDAWSDFTKLKGTEASIGQPSEIQSSR